MKSIPYAALLIIGLIVGTIIALFIGNVDEITIKKELTFGELGNIVVTMILAFIIPLSLNKWMDDSKAIKGLFVYEVDASISALNDIKLVIEDAFNSNVVVSETNKRKITFLFTVLDNKIDFLIQRLADKYSTECDNITKEIEEKSIKYWTEVTSGDLMTQQFVIDDNFMRKHSKAYSAIENALKKTKYDVSEM